MTRSGGLRFAPTPGYSLATLRVENADDEQSVMGTYRLAGNVKILRAQEKCLTGVSACRGPDC